MPRLIKIPDCSYNVFENIRAILLDYVPFAIVNDVYHRGSAYFLFFDSAYIPINLQTFTVAPPFDMKGMEKALRALREVEEPEPEDAPDHKQLHETLIGKWTVNAELAYNDGDNVLGTTILEFLKDLGDPNATQTLARLGGDVSEKELLRAGHVSIPHTDTIEELEVYLEGLPEELRVKLRGEWRIRKREEVKEAQDDEEN